MKLVGALIILFLSFSPDANCSPSLTGTWYLNGESFLELKADGTGSIEGAPLRWRNQGSTLLIDDGVEPDSVPYRFQGDTLLLGEGEMLIRLERPDIRREPSPNSIPIMPGTQSGMMSQQTPSAGASGMADELSRLLLSSAWCSFSYNQISGASNSTRIQFYTNGSYSNSSQGETYSSNQFGSVAGQHSSGGSGQWRVDRGQLYITMPPEQPQFQPVALQVSRNSNGYPIIKADGTEYSMCQ